ncbi:MAG: hypothetical protein LBT26_05570 [Clostridiales Family XIII bacterium]|jgi:hypothetical protein|nr:hypothetical protein [Clostridiales Family XIII bacterium]
MKPLISIETVPISIEYNSTRPQASSTRGQSAKVSVSREHDRVTIKSDPIQIQLQDRFEPNVQRPMTYTATAEYPEDGLFRMNIQIQGQGQSQGPADDAYRFQAAGSGIDRMVDAVPKAPAPAVSSMPLIGMKIDFDIARLAETHSMAGDFEASFIPPDLEVEIVEYPKVIIKYIGGPIYFPKSADPNYEPPAESAGFRAEA